MKRKNKSITNPDELNKNLQYSSPITWIVLTTATLLLIAFFAWSAIYKFPVKITGKADVISGVVTLHINETKRNEVKEGQKVYISGQQGEITSFNDNQPVVTGFSLNDGEFDYYIVIKEVRPIEFLFK